MNHKKKKEPQPLDVPRENDLLRQFTLDDPKPKSEGELANAHDDPEDSGIFLAACRIIISGYKVEISRSGNDSLFIRAAFELLHHFLESQFSRHSRAA